MCPTTGAGCELMAREALALLSVSQTKATFKCEMKFSVGCHESGDEECHRSCSRRACAVFLYVFVREGQRTHARVWSLRMRHVVCTSSLSSFRETTRNQRADTIQCGSVCPLTTDNAAFKHFSTIRGYQV